MQESVVMEQAVTILAHFVAGTTVRTATDLVGVNPTTLCDPTENRPLFLKEYTRSCGSSLLGGSFLAAFHSNTQIGNAVPPSLWPGNWDEPHGNYGANEARRSAN